MPKYVVEHKNIGYSEQNNAQKFEIWKCRAFLRGGFIALPIPVQRIVQGVMAHVTDDAPLGTDAILGNGTVSCRDKDGVEHIDGVDEHRGMSLMGEHPYGVSRDHRGGCSA